MDKSRLRNRSFPRVRVGSNSEYAKAHEFGGTVTAKDGYLTIPLTAEAKRMRRKKLGLKQFKLVTVRSKGGNLLMGKPAMRRQQFKPLFLLKRSITLPARPFVRPPLRRMRSRIIAIFKALPGAKIRGYSREGALSARQTSITGYRP